MASRLATHTHVLPPEDHTLLRDAIEHWHDMAKFDDEKVARVKGVFRIVFDLAPDTILVGSALPDAIVLQTPGDRHTFYAIVQEETAGGGAWEAMELNSDGDITFNYSTPFRLILELLALSTGGLTVMHSRWQDLASLLTRNNCGRAGTS